MNIVKVKQNWPEDVLKIDLTLGNICNYKCWYCFTGCNDGDIPWPDFDSYVDNLTHLMDYYIANTNKRRFDFHVMGGEVTHWKKFLEFITYFKTRYDCIFTLTTNASKKLDYWEKASPYLDYVTISTHHEFCNPEHVRNVADLLYEKNVIVNTVVLMDPFAWDKCMDIIKFYKKSKRKWSIRYLEIIHQDTIVYTEKQRAILNKLRARRSNIFWFWKNNKSFLSRVKVLTDNGKWQRTQDHELVFKRLNHFQGWSCSAGVDWLTIKLDGNVSAVCNNPLYDNKTFNLLDKDFKSKFKPVIQPTVCEQTQCWCLFEVNMNKEKLPETTVKKIIPIYAH
jgi:MoaA/NifB/PqqE/SkfB family radical SAM enzyme